MEVKNEISYKLLCNACLCVGQGLKLITDLKLKRFYVDALNEIPQCNIADITPVLCWDCEALLRRAMHFKERVKNSYKALLTYSSENLNECFLSDLSRAPRLQVNANDNISISPDDSDESVLSVGRDVGADRLIKDELKIDWEYSALPDLSELPEVGPNGTQQIYLKDNLKVEDGRGDGNVDEHSDSDYQPVPGGTPKKRKPRKGAVAKRKKVNKLKLKKETKTRLQINTIELSFEDMMLERDGDKAKDSYTKAEYKCEDCVIGFNYYKSYRTHLSTKHAKSIGEYVCPVCKTVHATLDSFTGHYKRHMRRYECSLCQKRTMDLKVMQQHYYSTHEITLKQYRCGDCGKVSNSIDAHRYHRESHKARLQCAECEKTFRHRAGLLNHRLAVHEYKNKFPCNICTKVFKWRTSLKRHQYVHESKKPKAAAAYCAVCGINFSSLCSYQRHMNNSLKHITKDQLRFICDHCNIKFADKTKLRDHIEEKHLHRTFQCNICLKMSKNRVGLDQHVRNVHKGRPNNKMCHHCGKGFPTKVQLESHIRTHTGERPFICEYCPTTFSQQSNLYKHNRQVHLNVKSKRYPTCKKKIDVIAQPEVNTMDAPPVSVVLHYSTETGYLTAEL